MRHEPQGLEKYLAVDLSDFRNSLRRQPDRMTWQRVWLYLLEIDDEEAAQLVYDANNQSLECEFGDHDYCRSEKCSCVHHRAIVVKVEGARLKSCAEMEIDSAIEQEETEVV